MPSLQAGELVIETARSGDGMVDEFWRRVDRDWRSEAWNFRVVWHEQRHDLIARRGERIAGGLYLRIAASLAHIEAMYVVPEQRRQGIARTLVSRAEIVANYYNCHKIVVAVHAADAAQTFFEACGYKVEATLPQHTFKLDVALLRKFLL